MKRIISLLLVLTTILGVRAQGGSGQGFDPTNPPDPQIGHRLVVTTVPKDGGTTIPVKAMYPQTDESVYCNASERLGYEFKAWMVGDSVVSTDRSFYFQMPDEDVVLTAWFDKVDFNPANPDDPYLDGYSHKVSVYSSPSMGGYVNNNSFILTEGQESTLYAYPHTNYKFSCWKQDGKIISTDRILPVKMGGENLEFTAQFVFDPANPGEPLPNSWNEATGELIIDHFEKGDLWSAIYQLVENNYESVARLVVIGEMDSYDLGVVSNLSGLTEADFSRTSGYTYVPSWIFINCPALSKLMLPASISEIHDYAFYSCENLSELVMYAAMPPTVWYDAFYGVPANMVVKVYSNSVDLYSNTDPWSNYRIMTIDEDSTALMVTLPADALDGRYANASLQLNNLSTGQSQRLIITGSRVKYLFGNLIPDLKYSLYVLSPGGQVIGKYLDFEMPQEGMDYVFDSLLQLQEVKLSLITPEGNDVADEASITWFDEKHDFLGVGSALPGQVEGYNLSYEISLPNDLGTQYQWPADGTWSVKESDNNVRIDLTPLTKITVSGAITDGFINSLLKGAYVTVTQTVNDRFTVSSTATTDADGAYSLTVYDAPGTVTVGSPEHQEMTVSFKGFSDIKSLLNMTIKPLTGTDLTLDLLSRDNIVKGAEANAFSPYEDFSNVNFNVTNLTQNREVRYLLRYPRMLLLDTVEEGDLIEVVATPRNSSFNPATEQTKIVSGKGDMKITFTANGDLRAKYGVSDAEEVVALLYDSEGHLLKKDSYKDNSIAFNGLPDGEYSLVTMMASTLFSAPGSIKELANSRLVAGTDYILDSVKIESGYITEVEVKEVPVFDETLFSYTGGETSVGVNKTSVTVGQIVTVRSKVEFLPEYKDRIEKVNVIFTLPEGCDYVENSLLVAGRGSNFTVVEDGRLSVDMYVNDASPRFCIIPRKGGDYRPSAVIEFELDGEKISQPIGSALFTAGDFNISVPEKTSVARITARGTATALSEVKVYDNNVFIGSTRSLTNGDWRLKFDLYDPGDTSEHFIYAEITTPEGQKYTTTGKTLYDKDWAEVTDIQMIYGGMTADFNHIDATTVPGSYSYVPGNDMFTFKAIFRDDHAAKVNDLDFVVLLSDGSRRRIEGKYLSTSGYWVCAFGFPDVNRLPVNVKVYYTEKRYENPGHARDIVDDPSVLFRCPDIVPIIDPSGYVYEAVPSNRLEGVTATIFYKEWVEDMYGDVSEKVVKWDAEAYAQQNPLFTDADGMYQWDVPQGEWQVRFEKEGYEVALTEWLPVPPPQLDVNIGMTQTVRPVVKSARAFEQALEVEFDKYMDPATLTSSNLAVTVSDAAVEGEWTLLNGEENPDGATYASVIRFEAAEPFNAETVSLMVSNKVMSYAGIRMEEAFAQDFVVEREVKELIAPAWIDSYVDRKDTFEVEILPAEAVAGRKLYIECSAPLAVLPEYVNIGEDGKASINFTGELPGEMVLSYRVEDSNFTASTTTLALTVISEPAKAPVASVESDTDVDSGTSVELMSETEGATIWYTIDGSDPLTSETRILYTDPIYVTEDITVNAYAEAEGYLDSEVATYRYTVKVVSGVDEIEAGSLKVTGLEDNSGFAVKGVAEKTMVTVYDMSGSVAMAPVAIYADGIISTEGLKPGVYVVKAVSGSHSATLKILKK